MKAFPQLAQYRADRMRDGLAEEKFPYVGFNF
jgi:hypothetical protein